MSDCCSSGCATTTDVAPKKRQCTSCGEEQHEVPYSTVLHHVKTPWKQQLSEQPYYFCSNADCNTVYFGLDNTLIVKADVRTKIGVKETDPDALICYCFDVSRANAKIAKIFVVEQTKAGVCSCTTHNPSGRCCLKDFPKDKS